MFGATYKKSNELGHAAYTASHPPMAALTIPRPFMPRRSAGKGPHPMNPVTRKPVMRKLDEAELMMLVAPVHSGLGRAVTKVRCWYEMASG